MQEILRALGLGPMAAAWFALQLMLMMLGALVAGPGALRRLGSVPPMLACVLLPLLAPLPGLPRALLAVLGLLGMLKMLQLDFEPRWQAHHPLWHGLMPFDVSTARRAAPTLDARLLARMLAHAALLALVLSGLLYLPAPGVLLREPWRLSLGAAMVYLAMEIATEGLRFGHRLLGMDVPPIQEAPVLSRSVGEFWSRRWNRPVSAWLNEYAFLPLAKRRRPLLGLLLAFAVSAAMHAWMFYAAVGLRAAASAAIFFLLQAPVVMLETRLRIGRWPAPLAHAWTLGILLLGSPLFVAPLLLLLGL